MHVVFPSLINSVFYKPPQIPPLSPNFQTFTTLFYQNTYLSLRQDVIILMALI